MGSGTGVTYWTVQHILPFPLTLLDVLLKRAGVERLDQFEAAQELARHRHYCAPVIKFAAVLPISLVISLGYVICLVIIGDLR